MTLKVSITEVARRHLGTLFHETNFNIVPCSFSPNSHIGLTFFFAYLKVSLASSELQFKMYSLFKS